MYLAIRKRNVLYLAGGECLGGEWNVVVRPGEGAGGREVGGRKGDLGALTVRSFLLVLREVVVLFKKVNLKQCQNHEFG